jgi:hypothetical protein
MIELKEPRPPAPPDTLAETEERLANLGHRIPPSYRAFLAEQDGGRPVRNTFTFDQHDREQSSRVAAFLGVEAAPDGDLAGTAELVGDIPSGVLPIAGDEFGNYVCIDTRNDGDGPILFWDHEEGFDDGEPDESNLYEVAPDLETFLAALSEPTPPPAAAKSRRGGLGRLFGRQ